MCFAFCLCYRAGTNQQKFICQSSRKIVFTWCGLPSVHLGGWLSRLKGAEGIKQKDAGCLVCSWLVGWPPAFEMQLNTKDFFGKQVQPTPGCVPPIITDPFPLNKYFPSCLFCVCVHVGGGQLTGLGIMSHSQEKAPFPFPPCLST